MSCCQCEGLAQEFDDEFAAGELRQYREKGLRRTSRVLVEAIRERMNGAETLLDIGGGVGGIQLELLEAGVRRAVSVDAAPAFVAAAQVEALRQGVADRIDHRFGNFVELADEVEPADVVTLDRVICCYPDMRALVGASAARARRIYGAVLPRSTWWTRIGVRFANLIMRMRRSSMRGFVHPTEEVDAVLRREGFRLAFLERGFIWQVLVYVR